MEGGYYITWYYPRVGSTMAKLHSVKCQNCGQCCRFVALPLFFEDKDIEAVFHDWASARGWRFEDGFLVIPSICPRLYQDPDTGKWLCSVHAHKPEICRQYPTADTWLPAGCAYGVDEKNDS